MAFGKKKREAKNLFENGSKAIGVLLRVDDTGMTINDNPRLRMTFRIEPLDGSPQFEGRKTKTISRAQIPRAGDRFPVWYDPQDSDSWSEERRRFVLVHEMAHVKRFDALTQLLAQFAVALFWFDPLV